MVQKCTTHIIHIYIYIYYLYRNRHLHIHISHIYISFFLKGGAQEWFELYKAKDNAILNTMVSLTSIGRRYTSWIASVLLTLTLFAMWLFSIVPGFSSKAVVQVYQRTFCFLQGPFSSYNWTNAKLSARIFSHNPIRDRLGSKRWMPLNVTTSLFQIAHLRKYSPVIRCL